MQKITQDSLRELNAQVDPAEILTELGSQKVEAEGDKVVADCPLEPGGEGTITVDASINFGVCSSESCPAHQRRSMLWIYCKGHGVGLHDGAQRLASQVGVLLEYEGEEPPTPKTIELADASELGPVESASITQINEQDEAPVLTCPLLKADCVQRDCQWWVVDWIEEKAKYRRNCAISLIAIGMTDESLTTKKK